MLDTYKKSKLKNTKSQNWKLALSSYRFDVTYRPVQFNSMTDALTRNVKTKNNGKVILIFIQENLLEKLNKDLGCQEIKNFSI